MAIEKKTEQLETENVVDDISNNEVEDKLALLKAQLAAKRQEKEVITIVEKKRKSLVFGMIGSGQSGSRLSCLFNSAGGYPAIAINTAAQDLEFIDLPKENKLLIDSGTGLGGAAKDLDIGKKAAEINRDAIAELIQDKLSEAQVYIFCTSLGGGSGAGSHETIIDILSNNGLPIVVICVLPSSNEDVQTKQNALATLASLSKMAQNNTINNLIVVDNSKLEILYSNVSHQDFFTVANKAIFSTIDAFNTFSMQPSVSKSLDSMEFAKILIDGAGLGLTGEITVTDYASDDTALARAAIESLEGNLLASGFNLGQAKFAGVIFAGPDKTWKNIPHGAIDYCQAIIAEHCSGAEGIFRGTYVDNSMDDDCIKIYSMFSGLGLPESRTEQLRKEVEVELVRTKERAQTRNLNLTVNLGKDVIVSKADEVRNKINKNASTFSKTFGSAAPVKDFRKKS